MKKLIEQLHSEFRAHAPDVELLSNSDVIPFVDADSRPGIKTRQALPLPKTIVASQVIWD